MRTITCAALLVLLCARAEILLGRTWTDKSGKQIEAELVEVKGNIAILQKPGGKTLKVPLSKLSDEDVTFLKESGAIKESAKPKATSGKTANKPAAKPKESPGRKSDGTADKPSEKKPDAATVEVASITTYDVVSGVNLTLRASLAGKNVVGLDEQSCKIDSCVDDTGRDLTKHPKGFPSDGFHFLSAKAEGVEFHTNLPQKPAPGATKIHLRGELGLRCAAGEKSDEQAGVSMKTPSNIKVGSIPLQVKPSDVEFEENTQTVTLASTTPAWKIKKFVFLDADGKELRKSEEAWAEVGGGFEKMFGVWTAADKITVRLITYDNMETVKIPLDMEFGAGVLTSPDSETSEEPAPDVERPIEARTKPTISQLPAADAPVHKVSAKEFAADLQQADKGAAKYKGSWVEVTGIFRSLGVVGDANYDAYVLSGVLCETEDFGGDDLVPVWFAPGEHPWEQLAKKETVRIRGAFDLLAGHGMLLECSVIKPGKTVMLNVTVDELAKQFSANPEAFVEAQNYKQAIVTGKFVGHVAPPETEDAKPEESIALEGTSGRRYYAFAGSGAREVRGLKPGQPIAVLGNFFAIRAEDSLEEIYLQASQNLTPFMPPAKQERAVTPSDKKSGKAGSR